MATTTTEKNHVADKYNDNKQLRKLSMHAMAIHVFVA